MPLSPPFRPTNGHPASPPLPLGPLPTLPFEVQRRIIHFRLLQTSSYPSALDDEPGPSWDDWTGVRGRALALKRVEERKDVTRTARGLMAVCKAWKPVVMKYLYASPYLSHNLTSLATAVLAGDAKWSDINIHAFSLPGRYITHLDLSTIPPSVHPTEIRRASMSIFPSLPNVAHLKLPPGELPFDLEEIGWAPFAKTLRCLEGIEADANITSEGGDALVLLLRRLPNLQVLSVVGGPTQLHSGESQLGDTFPTENQAVVPRGRPLSLRKLHSLRLEDVRCGSLLDELIAAELPSLDRLALTSHFGGPDDQTYTLQHAHGDKIRSLTYLQGKHWPSAMGGHGGLVPAKETLKLHPRLQHLAFLVPDYAQLEILLSTCPPHHPLRWLTIFKWVEPSRHVAADGAPTPLPASVDPATTHGLSGSKDTPHFLRNMTVFHPGNLKRINVDGFKWVKPELGKVAMDAGTSGEMRNWANALSKAGLELGDMDGNLVPALISGGMGYGPIERGGRRRSSGTGGLAGRVGMMSVNGVGYGQSGGHPMNGHGYGGVVDRGSTADKDDEEDDGG
ncbi:hypothetical protein IAU60_004497 [Kwoniella sp. DSM 27419]